MTSQCASGSGQFLLENIARCLGVTLDEIGSLSLQADKPEACSSICAVLAETDVINTGHPVWRFVAPTAESGAYGFPGSPAFGDDLVSPQGCGSSVYDVSFAESRLYGGEGRLLRLGTGALPAAW